MGPIDTHAVIDIIQVKSSANTSASIGWKIAAYGCRAAAGIQMYQTIEAWNSVSEEPPAPQFSPRQFFPFIGQGA